MRQDDFETLYSIINDAARAYDASIDLAQEFFLRAGTAPASNPQGSRLCVTRMLSSARLKIADHLFLEFFLLSLPLIRYLSGLA